MCDRPPSCPEVDLLPLLDHVQIAAPPCCEAAARRFFGDLLGLPELPKADAGASLGGCWFGTGSLAVHVGVDPDFRPAKKAHIALRVHDTGALQALAGRLEAAGHPVRWDARLPGVRRFFTEDPWGNRTEVQAVVAPGEQ